MLSSRRCVAALLVVCLLGGCAGAGSEPDAPAEVARPVGNADGQAASMPDRSASSGQLDAYGCPNPLPADGVVLCDPGTDNYKARFNADPDAPELRSWLALRAVVFDGERYVPAAGQLVEGEAAFSDSFQLSAEGGATAVLTAAASGDLVHSVQFRAGPQPGRFGVLLTLTRQLSAGDAVPVRLRVRRGDGAIEQLLARYTHDTALASAPPKSLEHNGPGGRWHVAGEPTRTNVELGWE